MSALTTSVICVLAFATLAHADGLERIAGGQHARQGQFPFIAAIRNQHNQHLCGGAIITNRHILTAGHCVQGNMVNPTILFAHVGAHTRADGVRHNLIRTVRHPNYHPQFALNDISVLITAIPIQYTNFVNRVLLPGADVLDNVPVMAFLSGFGLTRIPNVGGNGLPPVLQWKQTRTISRQQCRQQVGQQEALWIHETSLCTSNAPGQGACRGDSGAPLVTREGILIGLVTFGHCGDAIPEVYVRVFPQMNFIRAVANTPLN